MGVGADGLSIRLLNGGTDQLFTTMPYNAIAGSSTDLNAPTYRMTSATIVNPGTNYTAGGARVSTAVCSITVGGGGALSTISFPASGTGSFGTPPANPLFVTQGTNSSGTVNAFYTTPPRSAITGMHYGSDGNIYVVLKDKYNGQPTSGSVGRAVRVDTVTGSVIEMNLNVNNTPPTTFSRVPYCVAFFNNVLYASSFPDSIDQINDLISTDGTTALVELSVNHFGSCLGLYNGRLFYGNAFFPTGTLLYPPLLSIRQAP